MATNRNFTNFRAVYDDLTGEVERARSQFLCDHLENWFVQIDETPGVREFVKRLESPLFIFFTTWFSEITGTAPKRYGYPPPNPVEIAWPHGRDRRLGTQLLVFREIAKGKVTASAFAIRFLKGTSPETAEQELIQHVFLPMARDLRRRLEDELADREEATIPASDRVVKLDHNSAAYQEAIEALDKLEHTLRTANDYPDLEEKEQQIAEVLAGRDLLRSVRVRVGAVAAALGPPLKYLAKKFVDTGIGKAAGVAIEKLIGLLGSIF